MSISELHLPFQLVEVDMHRISSHAHLLHPLLVDLLDGRILELLSEDLNKGSPMGIPISGSSCVGVVIVRWYVPVQVMKVDPPVLGGSCFEEGGGEHHHLGVEEEVLSERFKVRLTVPQESVDVIVLPFELGRKAEQDWFDSCQGQ